MPFIARCPYCGQRSRVPESSEGSSGQCPLCGAFYTLVAEEEAGPANPAPANPGTAPEPEAPPLAGATRAVLPGTFVQSPGNAAAAPRRRMPAGVWLAGLGTAGLWWGAMIGQAKRALLLPGAASLAAAAVLIVAKLAPGWLGPVYEASRSRRVDPLAMQVVPLPNSQRMDNPRPDWIDASRAALRQGGTLVKITRVWLGPAAAPRKDGPQPMSAAGSEQHLFVRFQVFQGRPGKDKDMPATPRRPKLTDATGTAYDFRDGLMPIDDKPAKTPEAKAPALGREEVLAFAPPAASVEALRIEVPAERWRATGMFRFTIPLR